MKAHLCQLFGNVGSQQATSEGKWEAKVSNQHCCSRQDLGNGILCEHLDPAAPHVPRGQILIFLQTFSSLFVTFWEHSKIPSVTGTIFRKFWRL
jgi:hypothetical protein